MEALRDLYPRLFSQISAAGRQRSDHSHTTSSSKNESDGHNDRIGLDNLTRCSEMKVEFKVFEVNKSVIARDI